MSAPPVRIRIGGAIDNTLASSLRTAAQMVAQSEKAIQQKKRETTRTAQQEARNQLKAEEAVTRAVEALQRQRSQALYRQYKEQEAAAERAARVQERAAARAQAAERREIEKTVQVAQRAFEKEARERARAHARSRDRFATRTSHRATRFLMPEAPLIPMVTSSLGSVARGAGVDFSLQSQVGKVVEFESAMVGLRNQARVAGSPMRESGAAEIKGVADLLGYDRSSTAAAVGAFATKTGDVNLGLDGLRELAKRAAATGANLEEMMGAAADVANGLGDIPNKTQKMLETIDGFIVQGARGAVEIKDMATKMPKYAASAGRFEGDTSTNMLKLGALGQLARSTGGATSAAEAATSVARFADTFGTNARAKQFRKHDIDIFGENGLIRDPFELIRESLQKTNGDPLEMGKLFASSLGVRSVRGLSNAYNKAGGGQAGMEAVNKMLDGFMKDLQLADEVLQKNLKERDNSTAVRAQKFNNKLEDVTAKLAASTLPALEKLERPLLSAADALASLVESAVDHPWAAVGVAIGGALAASVARAGLESVLRSALERALVGSPMPFVGGGAGGGGGIAAGGGVLATGTRVLSRGLVGGVLGGLAGAAIGDAFGDTGMGAAIGTGAGAGLMMGGPAAGAAGAALGAAYDQNEKLKNENAGMGIGDMLWGSITTGKGFYEQVDEENNRRAKADAAIREANESRERIMAGVAKMGGGSSGSGVSAVVAGGVQPLVQQLQTDNAALKTELQRSSSVQLQMLDELRRLNITPAEGGGTGTRVPQ